MQMKRIVNIRVTTSIFLGLMAGILLCYAFFMDNFSKMYLVLVPLILSLVTVGMLLYVYFTKKVNKNCETRKDVGILTTISVVGFAIAFCLGFLLTGVNLFPLKLIDNQKDVAVKGVVSDYVLVKDSSKKFVLDDCIVVEDNEILYSDIKIVIYTYSNDDIELGDEVYFVGDINSFNYKSQSEFDKLAQNICFSTYVDSSDMEINSKHSSLKDNIKSSVKELLLNNLSEDNANITYSILFGEKQGLNNEIKEVFSYAGISHILAVSGLHISVLVGIIYFILSKLKLNKYVRVGILFFILLFYSYLCSFSPSVVRASIMAILSAICFMYQIEYDALSSLSIAGVIILLFSPLSLFLVSFQLSFLCVFAIISFAPTLKRMFVKIKCPKLLAEGLAISIAVNIVILPTCFNYFDYVSLLGVITNLFVLPIFSILYVLLFVFTFMGVILPFMGVFLKIPNFFLHIIKVIADFVAGIDFGIFRLFHVGYLVVFLLIVILLILHFLMINKYLKSGFIGVLSIALITILVCNSMPIKYKGDNVLVCSQTDSNVVFYVKDNYTVMIGSNIDSYIVCKQLKELKIKGIDSIIAYDFQLNKISEFNKLCEEYSVKRVYVPEKFNYSHLANGNKFVFYNHEIEINDLKLHNIEKDDTIIGVKLDIDDSSFLIPELKPTISESNYIVQNYGDVDYIIVSDMDIKINFEEMNVEKIILLNSTLKTDENKISLKEKIHVNLLGVV
ncbi:MAG: ComEC family competence protein [Clostridiales bacterium]|nr:ComEC family competence protein [Clostridiales bacterium]